MTRAKLIVTALLIAGIAAAIYFLTRQPGGPADAAQATMDGYLRATYARDFAAAYDYLAAADQHARPRQNYVASERPYNGFTLEISQQLAGYMETWLIDRQASAGRQVIKIGYRVPAPAELNELLLDWDEGRLNALPKERQQALRAELTARKQAGKLLSIEGQETLELVEELGAWKVHVNWAAGTRVALASKLAGPNRLEVRFASAEVIAKSGELFLVNLTITNRSAHAAIFSVNHLVEPAALGAQLQLVECGLLAPTTLAPRQEKEFAMAYLLDSAAGNTHREIKLTYQFTIK